MNKNCNYKKGAALAILICIMMILMVLGIGLLTLGSNSRIFVMRDTSTVIARSAADAGLTRIVYLLNKNLNEIQKTLGTWSTPTGITNEQLQNCNATYSYLTPTFLSGTDPSGGFSLQATGISNGAKCQINSTVRLATIWDYALWVKNTMVLKNGASINWLNPSAEDLIRGFKVGTDSTEEGAITLNKNVTVGADIMIGPGGDPGTVLGGQKESEAAALPHTYASLKSYVWDPIDIPSLTDKTTSINSTRTITTADSGIYSSIDLSNTKNPTILTVDVTNGPVNIEITGNIRLNNSAQIQIIGSPYDLDPKNPRKLNLYVHGNITIDNSGPINTTPPTGWTVPDSRRLQIYGIPPTCTSITLKVGGNFYGAIYAPNANVWTLNAFPFVGAIAAKSFDMWNGGTFTYDCNLRKLSAWEQGVFFVVENWREDNSWQF